MSKQARETAAARAARLLLPEQLLWRDAQAVVAGVDEVGLGPLAGPVVAAAVVLPRDIGDRLPHLNDSKQMTALRRVALAPLIEQLAEVWSLGEATVAEVDALNVFAAARLAAIRAIAGCAAKLRAANRPQITHLLLDAHPLPSVELPQTCLVHGDSKSQSIAAASVLAKVARDRQMQAYGAQYAGYGLERHAGYPTASHLRALHALGATPIHRRSFRPVAQVLARMPAR